MQVYPYILNEHFVLICLEFLALSTWSRHNMQLHGLRHTEDREVNHTSPPPGTLHSHDHLPLLLESLPGQYQDRSTPCCEPYHDSLSSGSQCTPMTILENRWHALETYASQTLVSNTQSKACRVRPHFARILCPRLPDPYLFRHPIYCLCRNRDRHYMHSM